MASVHLQLAFPVHAAFCRVNGDWLLTRLLIGAEDVVRQRLHQSRSVAEFLEELQRLLAPLLLKHTAQARLAPAPFYACLVRELDAIGWNYLHSLAPDLMAFQLHRHDAAQRVHVLHVALKTG